MSNRSVPGLTNARVVVFGMARSGVGAARLAVAAGARDVLCTDLRSDAPTVAGCRSVYGRHQLEDLLAADLVVLSPGIPPHIRILEEARKAGVPVLGELEIAASVLSKHRVPILAVTGTNGKSSTVWLLHQIILQAGRSSWVGGNLGDPLSSLACALVSGAPAPDAAVVEVSSYQLETIQSFRAHAAVVLNLTPDHLARHKTMAAYGAAKMGIFAHQQAGDLAVIPADHPLLSSEQIPAHSVIRHLGNRSGAEVAPDHIQLNGRGLPTADFALPGHHNRLNLAAALLLANHVGIDPRSVDLSTLRSLPHRMELVHVDAMGTQYINDSKATNVDAALVGVSAAPRHTVFLLGGQGKDGADYTRLAPHLHDRARRVICFGSAGPTIAAQLTRAGLDVDTTSSLEGALSHAQTVAVPGDTILLSPACASFDAYSDFEARGRHFTDLVRVPPSPE